MNEELLGEIVRHVEGRLLDKITELTVDLENTNNKYQALEEKVLGMLKDNDTLLKKLITLYRSISKSVESHSIEINGLKLKGESHELETQMETLIEKEASKDVNIRKYIDVTIEKTVAMNEQKMWVIMNNLKQRVNHIEDSYFGEFFAKRSRDVSQSMVRDESRNPPAGHHDHNISQSILFNQSFRAENHASIFETQPQPHYAQYRPPPQLQQPQIPSGPQNLNEFFKKPQEINPIVPPPASPTVQLVDPLAKAVKQPPSAIESNITMKTFEFISEVPSAHETPQMGGTRGGFAFKSPEEQSKQVSPKANPPPQTKPEPISSPPQPSAVEKPASIKPTPAPAQTPAVVQPTKTVLNMEPAFPMNTDLQPRESKINGNAVSTRSLTYTLVSVNIPCFSSSCASYKIKATESQLAKRQKTDNELDQSNQYSSRDRDDSPQMRQTTQGFYKKDGREAEVEEEASFGTKGKRASSSKSKKDKEEKRGQSGNTPPKTSSEKNKSQQGYQQSQGGYNNSSYTENLANTTSFTRPPLPQPSLLNQPLSQSTYYNPNPPLNPPSQSQAESYEPPANLPKPLLLANALAPKSAAMLTKPPQQQGLPPIQMRNSRDIQQRSYTKPPPPNQKYKGKGPPGNYRGNPMDISQEGEELVYQMDEEGFLMDDNGNYLVDQDGNYLRLSESQIEELKMNNCIEEQ